MMKKTESITYRVLSEEKEVLKEIAASQNITLSQLSESIIKEYLQSCSLLPPKE